MKEQWLLNSFIEKVLQLSSIHFDKVMLIIYDTVDLYVLPCCMCMIFFKVSERFDVHELIFLLSWVSALS